MAVNRHRGHRLSVQQIFTLLTRTTKIFLGPLIAPQRLGHVVNLFNEALIHTPDILYTPNHRPAILFHFFFANCPSTLLQ